MTTESTQFDPLPYWRTKSKSHPPRKEQYHHVCADCGDAFTSGGSRSIRCPTCAKSHRNDSMRAYRQEHPQSYVTRGGSNGETGRPRTDPVYRVVVDPDRSWGYETRLYMPEIRELITRNFLAPGTVFEGPSGRLIVVPVGKKTQLRKY